VLVEREVGADGRLAEIWRAPTPAVAARQFIRLRVAPRL
jgi:hypothetical protein